MSHNSSVQQQEKSVPDVISLPAVQTENYDPSLLNQEVILPAAIDQELSQNNSELAKLTPEQRQERISQLEAKRDAKKRERDEIKQEHKKIEQERDRSEKELDSAKQREAILQQEIQELPQRLEEAEKKVTDGTKKLETIGEQKQEIEEGLLTEEEKAEAKKYSDPHAVADIGKKLQEIGPIPFFGNSLASVGEALEENANTIASENKEKLLENQQKEEVIADLEEQEQTCLVDIERAATEVVECRKRIVEAPQELAKVAIEIKTLEQQIARFNSELAVLEKQISALDKDIYALESEIKTINLYDLQHLAATEEEKRKAKEEWLSEMIDGAIKVSPAGIQSDLNEMLNQYLAGNSELGVADPHKLQQLAKLISPIALEELLRHTLLHKEFRAVIEQEISRTA